MNNELRKQENNLQETVRYLDELSMESTELGKANEKMDCEAKSLNKELKELYEEYERIKN